jgi:hypothetical protein
LNGVPAEGIEKMLLSYFDKFAPVDGEEEGSASMVLKKPNATKKVVTPEMQELIGEANRLLEKGFSYRQIEEVMRDKKVIGRSGKMIGRLVNKDGVGVHFLPEYLERLKNFENN